MTAKQAGTDDETLIRNAELVIEQSQKTIKLFRESIYVAVYRMVQEHGSSETARRLNRGRSTVEYLALKGKALWRS